MNLQKKIFQKYILLTKPINIYLNEVVIQGNNQMILLEQLEQAGVYIPYSCRVGMCGYCQIKLEQGEIHALNKSAILKNKMILCCSCIPKTSLTLLI